MSLEGQGSVVEEGTNDDAAFQITVSLTLD